MGRNLPSVSCFLSLSTHVPQPYLKKQAVPENRMNSAYSMSTDDDIGDLHTRLGAEGISIAQHCNKDMSSSDIGRMEIGSPPLLPPGVELQEDHEKLNEKGGVHCGSRMSLDNWSNTSSGIGSSLNSSLGQLPAYFSTNGKSKNRNA